jgi:hypothetical protein
MTPFLLKSYTAKVLEIGHLFSKITLDILAAPCHVQTSPLKNQKPQNYTVKHNSPVY